MKPRGGVGQGSGRAARRGRAGRRVTTAALVVAAILWFALPIAHAAALPTETTVAVSCTNEPTVDTPALAAALKVAEHGGGTVSIGAGTCALDGRMAVTASVTVAGAGPTATFLVQHAQVNIFQITGNGVTIENLNLDTASYNASIPVPKNPNPAVLYSNANDTTVTDVIAEAGSGYGMRFVGPSPCTSDLRGGEDISGVDITTTGTGGFAAVDLSCQNGASLTGLTIDGGVVAMFKDSNVELSGEMFTPGPNSKACAPPWFVTAPANAISIDQVTSAGGPGIIRQPSTNMTVTNQTITNSACVQQPVTQPVGA